MRIFPRHLAGALVAVVALALPAGASAFSDHKVKATSRNESSGAVAGDGVVWRERTSRTSVVYADHPAYGSRLRISRAGYYAGPGSDIEGVVVVYAEASPRRGSHYQLMAYDLATGSRRVLLKSTRYDYYWPTLSGDWLLFTRWRSPASDVILKNLRTGEQRVVAHSSGRSGDVYAGQVAGDYVAYAKAGGRTVAVYRYAIATGRSARLKGPGSEDYYPAMAADGTTYWVSGTHVCGHGVRIVRQPLVGARETLLRLPEGVEGGDMNLADTRLVHSRVSCGRTARWDVYRIDVGPYDA